MNIKVQKQRPNRNEGAQGEMRLIMMARGSWLYIKGGNQWHTFSLTPSESIGTKERQLNGELQKNIRFVSETIAADTAGTYGGDSASTPGGSIMRPGGKGRKAALPDAPS